jgi:hypothetical protein
MFRARTLSPALLAVTGALAVAVPAAPQGAPRPIPARPAPAASRPITRLEPIAETRLLMEGLAQPNFRSLERLLGEKPADLETWTFVRGQALLIAETGNLLLVRPPRQQGQAAWTEKATAMRTAATSLARAAGSQDFGRSRAGVVELANTCNRCHQTFRIPVHVTAFAEPPERKGEPREP